MFNILQTAVVFGLVLGVMVVLHEFGHFIVAKLFGVRVEVFSVGMGKRLWGFKRGDTDYRLSLIPIGGYVKMAGENPDSDDIEHAPDEFVSKPKWQRFCIAVAGPAMNILTALAIPATQAMIHHEVYAYLSKPAVVNAVQPGSAADKAGVQAGDVVLEINGRPTNTWLDLQENILIRPGLSVPLTIERGGEKKSLVLNVASRTIDSEKIGDAGWEAKLGEDVRLIVGDVVAGSPAAESGLQPGDQIVGINGTPIVQSGLGQQTVIQAIQDSKGQPVTLTVNRNGASVDLTAAPKLEGTAYRLGFGQQLRGIDMTVTRLSPPDALAYSYDYNLRIVRLTAQTVGQWIAGERSPRDTLSGPIGILRMTGRAAEQGIGPVLDLTAFISLNLGVFNLLPIPVLDGGLIFMLILEAILGVFGFSIGLRVKERITQVGLVVLMLLMAFAVYNDISKWIPSGSSSQPKTQPQQAEPNK